VRPSDARLADARRRARGPAPSVPVAFVAAADPAAALEPPRPPGVDGRYVWRGALPPSARMHQGTVYPPAAGWLLRSSARGVARESRGYEAPAAPRGAPDGHGDAY
jgi:hypothetical protein